MSAAPSGATDLVVSLFFAVADFEWFVVLAMARDLTASLHPLLRAYCAFHRWPLTGIGPKRDVLEGAVVVARLLGAERQGGALFAPLRR